MDPKIEKQLRDIAWLAAKSVPITIDPVTATAILDEINEQRAENTRLMSLLGEAMNPPPTDYRADAIASHLWLSQAGVPAAKTLVERVKGLAEQLATARRFLVAEQEQCSRLGADNLRRMQRLGVGYPSGLDSGIDRIVDERDAAVATLARLQPLRSVLGDYDWTGAKADGLLPEGAEQKVIDAFAYVEAAERKAKDGTSR